MLLLDQLGISSNTMVKIKKMCKWKIGETLTSACSDKKN